MKQENDEIVLASELAEEVKHHKEPQSTKFMSETLDMATGGIVPGDYIVIGGKAGGGKTSWCVDLTKKLSKQGKKVLWFSCEETPYEFLKRFDETFEDIIEFYVPKTMKEPTMTWIERKIQEGIEKYGIEFVFIDHIGLIMTEKDIDRYRQNSLDIFEERVARLRQIAKDKEVAMFIVFPGTQETNKKKKKDIPTYADLKGSSRISYEASKVFFIRRALSEKDKETPLNPNDNLDPDWDKFMNTDTELWILKDRRTGMQDRHIRLHMENGVFYES